MSSLFDEMMQESLEKDQKIADLEAKLAEKDRAIENWQTMYESVMQTCGNDANEIKKLKKQNDDYADILTKVLNENADLVFKLAEKEKEIKQIKDKLHISEQETLHFHNKYFAEKQIAIEQLEKVKEFLYSGFAVDNEEIEKELDNQIKQLKEIE